jgi:2'-5' RNA ligase
VHLTVRFLGDVDDGTVRRLDEVLTPSIPVAPFAAALGRMVVAPPAGRPRGIWIEVADQDDLAAVAAHVGNRLTAVPGLASEGRPYRPHVTIARVRHGSRPSLRAALERVGPRELGALRVDAITLFESRLSPEGPTYLPRRRTPLAAVATRPRS